MRSIGGDAETPVIAGEKKTNVSIVYGSFCHDESLFDSQHIARALGRACGDDVAVSQPVDGDSFDVDRLIHRTGRDTSSPSTAPTMLIVSTSSRNGYPPDNLVGLARHLRLASTTNPGCLSHLSHAVWGNGDDRWWGTYMNAPRVVDRLLEECGSRRAYARGERGEPFAPLPGVLECAVEEWAAGLAEVVGAEGRGRRPAVGWDALWSDDAPCLRHTEMIPWDMESMLRTAARASDLKGGISPLCEPKEGAAHYGAGRRELERHRELLLRLLHEEDERKRRFRERLASRRAKGN